MRKILMLILALLLAACSTTTPPEVSPTLPEDTAEVLPTSATPPTPYPEPTQAGAPTPTELPTPTFEEVVPTDEEDLPMGPEFFVDPPVEVGVTQIKGRGPAGLPIALIDYDDGGKELAKTTIGADGSFTLDVAGKLVEAHVVALKLGDTAGTQFNPADFANKANYTDDDRFGTLFVMMEVAPAGEFANEQE